MDVDTAAAKLIERLESWMNSLEGIASQHAAEAWERGLSVYVIDGIGDLRAGAMLLLIGAALGVVARVMYRRAVAWARAQEPRYRGQTFSWHDHGGFSVGAILCGVFCGLAAFGAILVFTSPWVWVSITDPATALARDLLR